MSCAFYCKIACVPPWFYFRILYPKIEQAFCVLPSMQKKKKNHVVPRSYLRPFAADAKRKKIWVLSKDDRPAILKPIEKVVVRFHFYAPANEKVMRCRKRRTARQRKRLK